jgi:hypothetical protein
MSKNLTKEDLEKFEEFEKTILNLKDSSVKYKRDDEIEIQIKRDILYSNFGKSNVDKILEKLEFNFSDLIDQKAYIKIYKILDS